MARLLLLSPPMHNLLFSSSMSTTTLLFAILAVFSIFSIIAFLCGTRNTKKLHTETEEATGSKENKLISKLNSSKLSSRAVSMVKMLSWRKVRAEGEEEEGDYSKNQDEEEVLWRKNILMGERCRPLDFSGKSLHDSEGKIMLPDHLSHVDGHRYKL